MIKPCNTLELNEPLALLTLSQYLLPRGPELT